MNSSSLVPPCSPDKGDSKTLFLQLKTEINTPVPPCSPIYPIYSTWGEKGSDIRGVRDVTCIYNNNGGGNREQGNKPTSDIRFRFSKFRAAVRTVLVYFGYSSLTFGSFRNVEAEFFGGRIHWLKFAANITARQEAVRIHAGGAPGKYTASMWNKISELLKDTRTEQKGGE